MLEETAAPQHERSAMGTRQRREFHRLRNLPTDELFLEGGRGAAASASVRAPNGGADDDRQRPSKSFKGSNSGTRSAEGAQSTNSEAAISKAPNGGEALLRRVREARGAVSACHATHLTNAAPFVPYAGAQPALSYPAWAPALVSARAPQPALGSGAGAPTRSRIRRGRRDPALFTACRGNEDAKRSALHKCEQSPRCQS